MEQNTFNILQLREMPFVINDGVQISKEVLDKVRVTFVVMLQHQRNNPAVCLHTALRYMTEDGSELMHGGVSIVAKLPGWLDVCGSVDSIKQSPEVIQLVDYASAFVSGQFFHFAANTPMNAVFVPRIPAQRLLETIIIEAFDPMKG